MEMVDDKIPVHAVVLDFSKAFDRVPHRFLIESLLIQTLIGLLLNGLDRQQ